MHIRGHEPACADIFGLKYMANVGKTHSEGVETIWSTTNAVQETVRSSGFGARQDLLTNHFMHWNSQKMEGMGVCLNLLCLTQGVVCFAYFERFQPSVFIKSTQRQLFR